MVMSEPSELVSTREKLVPTRNSTRISEKSSECRALVYARTGTIDRAKEHNQNVVDGMVKLN